MADVDDALVLVCNLARGYATRDMSPNALIAESGYRKHRREIGVPRIRDYLAAHPALITDWINFSADKRVDGGWYILEESPGGPYVVGYYPDDPSKPKAEFKDAALASATYVKHELESLS